MTPSSQLPAVLWRRRWTLLATAIATFAAAAALTFALPRVYTSEAYLLVAPARAVNSDFEATQLSQILAKTYAQLLQGQTITDTVDERLGTTGSTDALSVTAVPQSQLLAISAEASTARQAQAIAGTTAEVFRNRVSTLSRSAGEGPSGTVSVAEPASLPTAPTRPKPLLYLALGALLATGFGIGAALVRERTDRSTDSAPDAVGGHHYASQDVRRQELVAAAGEPLLGRTGAGDPSDPR